MKNVIKLPDDAQMCSICGKRQATKLCDFPIAHSRWIGHPPRTLMERAKHTDTAFCKVEMEWTNTCGRPVCDQCSISMGSEIDICLTCAEKLRVAQAAQKGKRKQ